MQFSNMGIDNLISTGFNGIYFSLMGMGLVFSGLIIIAVYITLLPKLLDIGKKKSDPDPVIEQKGDEVELETMLAIAAAFHLHRMGPENSERITISHVNDSPWFVTGIMNSLGTRKSQSPWRKQ